MVIGTSKTVGGRESEEKSARQRLGSACSGGPLGWIIFSGRRNTRPRECRSYRRRGRGPAPSTADLIRTVGRRLDQTDAPKRGGGGLCLAKHLSATVERHDHDPGGTGAFPAPDMKEAIGVRQDQRPTDDCRRRVFRVRAQSPASQPARPRFKGVLGAMILG